jgi:fatty acid CoA ligase FadD36
MNQQRSPSLLPSLRGELGDRADAVRVAGEPVSWATLSAMANGTAARLLGARAVAIDARPTLQTVIAVAAGLAAGVAVVPVPPDAGPVERSHIIRDSGAEAVVGAADWPDVALARIELATDGSLLAEPADDVAALIVYTSGTTGSPKGVVLSRRAVAAGLDGLAAAWQWTADDTLVHGLPLFHVHGLVLGVLGALRVGCRLVHTGKPTPAAYAAAQGSLYFGVPTVWGRVCAEPAAATALRSARLLVSGSAPLPVAVFEQLRALTGHHPVEPTE